VRGIESDETKKHILELSDCSSFGQYSIDILITDLKTGSNIDEVVQMGRNIFYLLEPNSLIGRLVVGHGDLKYDNTTILSSRTRERFNRL